MCPDKEILSAYLDGEIPSPWNEKISEHLTVCGDCALHLKELEAVSYRVKASDTLSESDIQSGKERIFMEILSSRGGERRYNRFWHRQVAVPLPLLAAAAVILVLFMGLGLFPGGEGETAVLAENSGIDYLKVKLTDDKLDNLAELLKNRDAQVQVFIELPPVSRFDTGMEPQFIKAADYQRY